MDRLISYAELADLVENLPLIVLENRRRRQISLREAARELGVSFSTISRVERGEDFNSRILPDLLRWLGPVPEEGIVDLLRYGGPVVGTADS